MYSSEKSVRKKRKYVKISLPLPFYESLKNVVEREKRWRSIDALAREAGERIVRRHGLQ